MALRELNFTFTPDDPRPLPVGWFHRGVTGSGDMEVMLEQRNLAGDVQVKVCTPTTTTRLRSWCPCACVRPLMRRGRRRNK